MIANLSREVPKQRPEKRAGWHKEFYFLDKIGSCLQEVVPLIKGLFKEVVAFYWVALKKAHLLKVADSAMSQLG